MRFLRTDSIHQWTEGDYTVTTDRDAVDLDMIFRFLTDGSWFAWIGDMLVFPEHRGGRGQFLMRCVMEDLTPVRRVSLGTRDAQSLYARFGLRSEPEYVGGSMERIDDAAGT